jgi:hypothetical protein
MAKKKTNKLLNILASAGLSFFAPLPSIFGSGILFIGPEMIRSIVLEGFLLSGFILVLLVLGSLFFIHYAILSSKLKILWKILLSGIVYIFGGLGILLLLGLLLGGL